jgi:transcriptional regulator with GAF, ATPase, and Fis domain
VKQRRLVASSDRGVVTDMPTRETLIAQTFVQLADSLVDEFDIVDLLTVLADRCMQLLGATAAGILLVDQHGNLQVVAASSEQVRLLELFQLQNHEGPCLDCFLTGGPVINSDLAAHARWPRFSREALGVGFHSVQAVPLRLREVIVGTLNIFTSKVAVINEEDQWMAQALADVATIAILQNQAARETAVVVGQLQRALNSRIVIEQAKGMLAQQGHVDMVEAFTLLRNYSRRTNRQLSLVASEIVTGATPLRAVIASSKPVPRERYRPSGEGERPARGW